MSVLYREILIRGALVAAGPLFLFTLFEVGLRAGDAWSRRSQGTIEALAHERSGDSPLDIGTTTRLADLIQPAASNEVVYELRPNLRGVFRGKDFRSNAYGMRDGNRSIGKPEGVLRIAGIGDSVMFGWRVAENERYLNLVEEDLNRRGKGDRVETLNFAVPGYNTAMEVAAFREKGSRFQPDLVVLHFVSNDFTVPLFMQSAAGPWTLKKSFAWEFVGQRIRLLTGGRAKSEEKLLEGNLDDLSGAERQEVLDQYRHMTGRSGFKRAMKQLADLTGHGKIPVIFLVGYTNREMDRAVRAATQKWGFHYTPVKPYVDAWVAEHLPNATPKERQRALTVSPEDSHPNATGHQIYAKALLDALAKLGIPPSE